MARIGHRGHTLDPGQRATYPVRKRKGGNIIRARQRSKGYTLDPGQRVRGMGSKSVKPKKRGQALHSYKKPPRTPAKMPPVGTMGVPSGSIEKGTFKYFVFPRGRA